MEPTNNFRWLEFDLGLHHDEHRSAHIIGGTNLAIVLQQEWVECYAFGAGPVPNGKREWRDVVISC